MGAGNPFQEGTTIVLAYVLTFKEFKTIVTDRPRLFPVEELFFLMTGFGINISYIFTLLRF
jgi:hypothetical protein